MRALLLTVVILGACATQEEPSADVVITVQPSTESSGPEIKGDAASMSDPDICALAAALPADDICSLVCDPDALADALLARGSEPGACYQLSCTLSATVRVLAGVCLVEP